MKYAHLATRLFNTPIAITPDKAEIVMAALADRFGVAKLFRSGTEIALGAPSVLFADDDADDRGRYDPGYDVAAGIAVIPVCGTLVHKHGYMRPSSGMTGYDTIRAALSLALGDDDVKAIVLDIDSPGGEVSGCFDLVDEIYRARGTKKIWAVLSENAFSAAYAIASACEKITVPRTGGTGSVGVIFMHVEMSKAISEAGIQVNVFTYGARKADGSDVMPLSDEAKVRFQAEVDKVGELFVKTVARNRALSPSAVRDTQAGTFLGAAGVDIGFADAVMAPSEAFRALLEELG